MYDFSNQFWEHPFFNNQNPADFWWLIRASLGPQRRASVMGSKKYKYSTKGTVFFFFSRQSSYFTHFRQKSIEWMKKLFFFFQWREKKQLWDRMNEWTYELFQEKKNRKNTQKREKKKEHNLLFDKKIGTPPDFEWMANELFLGKKKNELQGFEWMNGPWTFLQK